MQYCFGCLYKELAGLDHSSRARVYRRLCVVEKDPLVAIEHWREGVMGDSVVEHADVGSRWRKERSAEGAMKMVMVRH